MSLILLELRKNALAGAAPSLGFLASLVLGAFFSHIEGAGAPQGLAAGYALWRFIAVPLGACLIGAACGAGLASESARERESALPASPLRRTVSSAAAAALLHSSYHALVFACLGLSPFDGGPFLKPSFQSAFGQLLLSAPFLIGSFAGAAITGSAIAGGLLGLAAGAGSLAPMALIFMNLPEHLLFDSAVFLGALAGSVFALAAAWRACESRERGRYGPRPAAALLALLLSPAALEWFVVRPAIMTGALIHLAFTFDEEEQP